MNETEILDMVYAYRKRARKHLNNKEEKHDARANIDDLVALCSHLFVLYGIFRKQSEKRRNTHQHLAHATL